MNKDNSKYDEDEYRFVRMCIRQKCLMCKDIKPGEEVGCDDYTCPLWMFETGLKIKPEDWAAREIIFLETCEKIHATR